MQDNNNGDTKLSQDIGEEDDWIAELERAAAASGSSFLSRRRETHAPLPPHLRKPKTPKMALSMPRSLTTPWRLESSSLLLTPSGDVKSVWSCEHGSGKNGSQSHMAKRLGSQSARAGSSHNEWDEQGLVDKVSKNVEAPETQREWKESADVTEKKSDGEGGGGEPCETLWKLNEKGIADREVPEGWRTDRWSEYGSQSARQSFDNKWRTEAQSRTGSQSTKTCNEIKQQTGKISNSRFSTDVNKVNGSCEDQPKTKGRKVSVRLSKKGSKLEWHTQLVPAPKSQNVKLPGDEEDGTGEDQAETNGKRVGIRLSKKGKKMEWRTELIPVPRPQRAKFPEDEERQERRMEAKSESESQSQSQAQSQAQAKPQTQPQPQPQAGQGLERIWSSRERGMGLWRRGSDGPLGDGSQNARTSMMKDWGCKARSMFKRGARNRGEEDVQQQIEDESMSPTSVMDGGGAESGRKKGWRQLVRRKMMKPLSPRSPAGGNDVE